MNDEPAPAHLGLYVLGPLHIGEGLRLPTRKAEALLAYLALPAGTPHRRDALMGLLWGDRGERQARHSLSQTLFSLRRALAENSDTAAEVLIADGDTVMLDAARVYVDAAAFERALTATDPDALAAAADLYRGELLQGLHLRELAFQDWLATERSRLREGALGIFQRLMAHHQRRGALDAAVQAAVRLLSIDPLQEEFQRALMRLYAAQGRPAAALRQYESCAEILRRELGEEPEPETRSLRDEIARQRHRRRPVMPAAVPAPERPAPPPAEPVGLEAPLFGREHAARLLRDWLQAVADNRRRLVFIRGEAGIGKTTLVNALVRSAQQQGVAVARGQCIDLRGPGEPYLPVLDAVSGLCRARPDVLGILQAHAPSWLGQLPSLALAGPAEPLPVTTPERMLREIVEALEAVTANEALLLVIEDINWSDRSTLDLIEALAYRRYPARLLVVATCREADAATSSHPAHTLARTLSFRGLGEEIVLGPLDEAAVEACLASRFPGAPPPPGLARVLCERSGGNPLFTQDLLRFWLDSGALGVEDGALRVRDDSLGALQSGVPANLAFTVEQQLDGLPEAQCRALEAGSVVGIEFSAAAVAAALAAPEEEVESHLSEMARRAVFLRNVGACEWPDGTLSSCFAFRHQLYREGIYERLPAGRRMRLHRRIGERLEAAFAGHTPPATELAMHFLHGRDLGLAADYFDKAARQAMRRSAHGDAVDLLRQGLALLPSVDEPQRAHLELRLRSALGPALVVTQGWAAPEAEATYRRTWELARELGDGRRLSSAMFGLATLLEFRARFAETQDILRRRINLLERQPDDSALVESEELMACSTFHHARFRAATEHARRALAGYDAARDRAITAEVGDNPAVSCLNWAARGLWFLGRPDESLANAQRALAMAEGDGYSFALAVAHEHMARLRQHRHEAAATLEHAGRAVALGEEYGFAYRMGTGLVLRGWARAMLETGEREAVAAGLADIDRGLAHCDRLGALLERPYFLTMRAEVLLQAGRPGEADEALRRALAGARQSEGYFYEAEILRLRGRLHLMRDPDDADGAAEAWLGEALEISRTREDAVTEMRVAADLARLWLRQGGRGRALDLLTAADGKLVGGGDLPDLQDFRSVRQRATAA